MSFDERFSAGNLRIEGRLCTQTGRQRGWSRHELVRRLKRDRDGSEPRALGKLGKRQLCRMLFDHVRVHESLPLVTLKDVSLSHSNLGFDGDTEGYQVGMIWFCDDSDSQCGEFYHKNANEDTLLRAKAEELVLLDLKAFLEDEGEKRKLRAWLDSSQNITLDNLEIAMDHGAQSGLSFRRRDSDLDSRTFASEVYDVMYQVGPGQLDANRDDWVLPDEALVPLESETFVVPPDGPVKGKPWTLEADVGNIVEISTEASDSRWLFRKVDKEEWSRFPYRAHMANMSIGVAALLKDYFLHERRAVDGWYQKDLAFPHTVTVYGSDTARDYTAFFLDANEVLVWDLTKLSSWSIGPHSARSWYDIRYEVFQAINEWDRPTRYRHLSYKDLPPSTCKGIRRPYPYKECKWWRAAVPSDDGDDHRALTCALTHEMISIRLASARWDAFYSSHRENLECVLQRSTHVTIELTNDFINRVPRDIHIAQARLKDLQGVVPSRVQFTYLRLSSSLYDPSVVVNPEFIDAIFDMFDPLEVGLESIYLRRRDRFAFTCRATSARLLMNLFGDEKVYLKPYDALFGRMPELRRLSLFGCSLKNFHDPHIWEAMKKKYNAVIYN